MTVAEIVRNHLEASERVRKSIGKSPKKAREFLVKAGVLKKSGKKFVKRSH